MIRKRKRSGKSGRSRESQKRVSEKISLLRHESPKVPQRQAVAEALSMERAGRLGRHGVYHRVGGRNKRGRRSGMRKRSRSRRY